MEYAIVSIEAPLNHACGHRELSFATQSFAGKVTGSA